MSGLDVSAAARTSTSHVRPTDAGERARRRPAGGSTKQARRRTLGRGLLSALLLGALLMPAAASAGGVDIGPAFGTIAVDDTARHVFVSDPQSNVVYELDFAGRVVTTIPNVYGATGMVIVGRVLYVVENTTGDIVKIDLSLPTLAPAPLATGLNGPRYVAVTGGRLWITEASAVASVDPATGTVSVLPTSYYAPDLATSPGAPNSLFVAELGLSPGAIYRLDVSKAPPTTTVSNTFTDQENIEGLVVSPDGKRVIPASGYPYYFEELSATTLKPDGLRYPGQPYPSAVAVSASGLLATGLDGTYSTPDLEVLPLGTPAPIFTATLTTSSGHANIPAHGVALSADGSTVFAVTSDFGASPTFFALQATVPPPTAAYTPSTYTPAVGQTVSFDANASRAPDGTTITGYRWVWGDGTPDGSGVTATHAFTKAGQVSVALYVTGSTGKTGAVGHGITVGGAPIAAYAPSTYTPGIGQPVSFDGGTSSAPAGATIAAYRWVWGDGTPDGSGVRATHAFATAGLYAVALYVTDSAGRTAAVGHGIKVGPVPTAAYTPSTYTPGVGQIVSFDASASAAPAGATITAYRWVWGDGTTDGSGVAASHSFSRAGKVSVALYVTDSAGRTAAVGHGVTVGP